MASKIAFGSTRDGVNQIFVMNRDGSNVHRLTSGPAINTTPTWSPSGTQIAFTSARTGDPAIYIIGADGSNLQRLTSDGYADRPTWSPAPFNEIAYASRTGSGLDIKVIDIATRKVTQLTFGEGTNESPAYLAERPAHRVHFDARRQDAGVHDVARRKEHPADHAQRQ